MVNGLKPYSLSGGDPASGPMRPGCLLRAVPSPLTPALSLGERENHRQADREPGAVRPAKALGTVPPLLRERAGVRGNRTQLDPARWTTPGTVKLWESPRQIR